MIDRLAESYYSSSDPQLSKSDDELIEINDRASRYVADACRQAISELTEEERESLKNDNDLLWDLIQEYL